MSVKDKVIQIIAEQALLDVADVRLSATLEDLGIDSLGVVESIFAIEEEFDIVTCQEMLIDHALSIPLELSWPDLKSYDFKLVPLGINTVQHPLPSPKRALALGRALTLSCHAFIAAQSCGAPQPTNAAKSIVVRRRMSAIE